MKTFTNYVFSKFKNLPNSIVITKVTIKQLFLRMAGSQEKSTKWFQETRKYKFPKRSSEHQRNAESSDRKHELLPGMNCYNCNYCTKVFVNAKFLVKHILRRHSENLVLLHKRILELPNPKNCVHSSSDLVDFLRMEFFDLKSELEIVKQTVSHRASAEKYGAESQSNTKSCEIPKPNKKTDSYQENKTMLSESITSDPNKPVIQVISADDQYILERIDEMFQVHKKDLVSKEEMERNFVITERKICEELKNNLLSEFQSMFSCHESKLTSKWKKHISELHAEIRRLDEAVMLNSQKINSPETSQLVEKKFEQKLQDILHSNLLLSNGRKNSNSMPTGHNYRRRKSVYTCTQALRKEKAETSGHSDPLSLEGRRRKKSHSEFHNKIKSLPNESEDVTTLDVIAVNSMVDEKLRSLNIDPRTEKLSLDEFEKTMSHLNNEKGTFSSKFVNFSKVRERMDSYINKVVKSKGKCSKKLHFSDSLIDPSPGSEGKESNKDLTSKQTNFSNNAEVSGCMLTKESVQDQYAQGDCHIALSEVIDTPITSTAEYIKKDPSKFFDYERSNRPARFTPTKNGLHSHIYHPESPSCKSESLKHAGVQQIYKDEGCYAGVQQIYKDEGSYGGIQQMHKDEASYAGVQQMHKDESCASKFDLTKSVEDLSDLSSLSDLEDENVMSTN